MILTEHDVFELIICVKSMTYNVNGDACYIAE